MSALLLVDVSDPNAKVGDTLLVTCNERQALMTELAALTKGTDADEFTKDAGLFETVLKTHKCR